MKDNLLVDLREGKKLSLRQQILLIVQLSLPSIMAQISSIIMQYIDASMVGRLGANDSAAIGLVSSSTWLFNGVNSAMVIGFSVQVAQQIGAGQLQKARNIMKHGYLVALSFSFLLMILGISLSRGLPVWLGGSEEICHNSSLYFLIFAIALPCSQLNTISSGMLQSSGNMKVPSVLHVLMCGLDVVFNYFLIFPGREVWGIYIPGADLGVVGAALGTALSHAVVAIIMTWYLVTKSEMLRLQGKEKFKFSKEYIQCALKISIPVAMENVIMNGAQIMGTRIVAPLGNIAVAANSFSVTAESLCYMPGYGVGTAATTLIGQSIGAKRYELTRKLGWITTVFGMFIMTVSGALMYLAAPWMIGFLSPDPEVVALGTSVLRIEAFAEPMFAASIVATGVFRGAGDTLVPSCFNFFSMWLVRLPLAAFLAPRIGLHGVWIAMCTELCVRGALFLIRLAGKRWSRRIAE